MNPRRERLNSCPLAFGTLAFVWTLACAPPSAQPPSVDLRVSPTPATVGNARVLVDVSDSTGSPLVGAEVRLEGRPATQEAVVTQREAVDEGGGRYVVSDFWFPAPGVWVLDVVVTPVTGESSRIPREVRVVGGGPSGR